MHGPKIHRPKNLAEQDTQQENNFNSEAGHMRQKLTWIERQKQRIDKGRSQEERDLVWPISSIPEAGDPVLGEEPPKP